MTGYGRGAAASDAGRAVVEIRTVNNRFADVQTRLGNEWNAMEPHLRERIGRAIVRGRAQVSVDWSATRREAPRLTINAEAVADLARQWVAIVNRLRGEAVGGSPAIELPPLTAEAILRVPGVLESGAGQDAGAADALPATDAEEDGASEPDRDDAAAAPGGSFAAPPGSPEALILAAAEEALAALERQRAAEGSRLRDDFLARLEEVERLVGVAEQFADEVVTAGREKLRARWEELSAQAGIEVDSGRLEMELLQIADRADVTEEVVRLRSHVAEARAAFAESNAEPVGKRLDFLMQEFAREANTIGSKARGTEVTRAVVDLKHEIEKMREQVQNLV
jgi:uncharacterized protein YicC (UPF0701 family)